MPIAIEPVKADFAARVGGVDMSRPPSPEDVAAIQAAILEYPVLVISG